MRLRGKVTKHLYTPLGPWGCDRERGGTVWELCIETIKKSQNEIETTQAILRRLLSPARQDHNRFRLTPYILRDGELAKSRTKTEKAHTHTHNRHRPTETGQHDRSPTFTYGRNASSFVRLVCACVL